MENEAKIRAQELIHDFGDYAFEVAKKHVAELSESGSRPELDLALLTLSIIATRLEGGKVDRLSKTRH